MLITCRGVSQAPQLLEGHFHLPKMDFRTLKIIEVSQTWITGSQQRPH